MNSKRGQVLLGAMVLLLALAVFVPILVQFVQTESRHMVKGEKNTQAFQLAEAAIERGYQNLILSTTTWAMASSGTVVTGFDFDQTYISPSGGEYQIGYSTGAGSSVYVTGVGRDRDRKEIRAIKAQYVGNGDLGNSIYSGGQVSVHGSANIEWGPVFSRTDITTGGAKWPRFYSTGKIDPLDTNPSVPNSDNLQYWAYYSNMPNFPTIDLNYYKTKAQTLDSGGTPPAACGGNYYKVGNITFQGCDGGGAGQSGTWYMTGNGTLKAGGGGNYLIGEVIILGNLEMNGNGGSFKSLTVSIPPEAWQEYCESSGVAWTHYQTMDGSAPASCAAATAGSYEATGTYTITNVLVNGLMYQGGNYQATGSGNASFYGVVYCIAQPSLGANMTLWYQPNLSMVTTSSLVQRVSWQDVVCTWDPSGNAVCP